MYRAGLNSQLNPIHLTRSAVTSARISVKGAVFIYNAESDFEFVDKQILVALRSHQRYVYECQQTSKSLNIEEYNMKLCKI